MPPSVTKSARLNPSSRTPAPTHDSPIVVSAAVSEDCTGVRATCKLPLSLPLPAAACAGIGTAVAVPWPGSRKPVLRRIALRVRNRSRFSVALGEAPVKLQEQMEQQQHVSRGLR
jgi:hypothetical protein